MTPRRQPAWFALAVAVIAITACDALLEQGTTSSSANGGSLTGVPSLSDGGAGSDGGIAGVSDPPTNVAAVPGVRSALISWTAPAFTGAAPLSGYRVLCAPDGLTIDVPAAATSATITALRNGISYSFTVIALNAFGPSAPSTPSSAVKTPTVPSRPLNVSSTQPSSSAITVFWAAPASSGGTPITAYAVRLEPSGEQQVVSSTVTSVTFPSIAPNSIRAAIVTAMNAVGRSDPASFPAVDPCPNFAFASPQLSGPVSQAAAMIAADLDDDGKADILLTNFNSATVTILSGTGADLGVPKTYGTWNGPRDLIAGQFDGLPGTDVAVANQIDQTVNVLPGYGNGALGFPWTLKGTGGTPIHLASADVDGDGDADLIVGLSESAFSVLLANGDGTFRRLNTYAVGGAAGAFLIGDVTSDGIPDVVFPNLLINSGALLVFVGAGNGEFFANGVPTTSTGGGGVSGDFDGDGQLDIADVVGTSVRVRRGDGNGGFVVLNPVAGMPAFGALAASDVNGDGVLDIVTGSMKANAVSICLGVGQGRFAPPRHYPVSYPVNAVALLDANQDGAPDIGVLTTYSTRVALLLNEGDGTFSRQSPIAVAPDGRNTVAADFDGDGLVDLAVANGNDNSFSILPGLGGGAFGAPVKHGLGTPAARITTTDLDGDGHADLVVNATSLNQLLLLKNTGTGGFTDAGVVSVGAGAYSTAAGDLNADGLPDLVSMNATANSISVALTAGDGGYTVSTYAAGSSPVGAVIDDLDGDGRADIVVANQGPSVSSISVFLANASGNWNKTNYSVTSDSRFPLISDFDGDGIKDIVVGTYGSPSIQLLKGLGAGTFASPAHFASMSNPLEVRLADVNGDGLPDVVGTGGGIVSVHLGDGAGHFEERVFVDGYGANAPLLEDVDLDGRPDLILTEGYSGSVSVELNRCLYEWPP